MFHDIKDALTPNHLFLIGSIDFQTNSLLGHAASLCYEPCRWIQGREVVNVIQGNMPSGVKSLPPLSNILQRPWVQTLLRIVVYLPTLIGRCLQALADRNSEEFKKDFALAREAVAYNNLLKTDFTQKNAYQKAEQELEFLVPTIDQREQLAQKALHIIATGGANVDKAAGFLCHYKSSLASFWTEYWTDSPALVEALASDEVYGAQNFRKFLEGGKQIIAKNKELFDDISDLGVNHLTEAQKKILAKDIIEGKLTFGNGYTKESVLLLKKLDFCGLDKMQVCKQLLTGITRDDSTEKVEDKVKVHALQGDARGLVYDLFDDFKAFFSAMEWKIDISDVVYMKPEAAKCLLNAQIEGHIKLALSLSKFSLDQIKIVWDLIHSSEDLKREYTDCFHNIFYHIHEKRLNITSEDSCSIKTPIITRQFLSSLSVFNLKVFIDEMKKAYFYSIKNCRDFPRDLRNLKFEAYYNLDNLAELQALKTSYSQQRLKNVFTKHPEWLEKRGEWLKGKFPPFAYDLFTSADDEEKVLVDLPLQYFNDMHAILTSHSEVFEKYVKDLSQDMPSDSQFVNANWRKDLSAEPQDMQQIIL